MSSSICRAAGRMSISSAVTPSASISFQAFDLVPSLVAKPGMVKPRIVGARQAEPVADLGGDDQRVGRVEPARDADHHVLAAGRLEPAHQALDLDVERLVAVLVELARAGSGTKGKRRIGRIRPTSPKCGRCSKRDARGTAAPGGRRASAASLKVCIRIRSPQDALGVDVGDAELGLEREALGLGQQVAELVDHALPVPGEVGRALAGPGGRIDVGGDGARRLRAAEQVALVGLADDDVRGRQVGEDRRAGQRARGRGRDRRPRSPRRSRRAARSRRGRRRRRSGPSRTAPRRRRRGSSRRRCRGRGRTSASRRTRGSWAGSSWAPRRAARPRAIASAQL